MTIRLVGTLLDPLGKPLPNTRIRFVSTATADSLTECSEAVFESGEDGKYDFSLSYGSYTLEVNYLDEYCLLGNVIADVDTPQPLTLQDLMDYTTPVLPPVVVPETPDWVALHDDLRESVNTKTRDKVDQISDGQTYTNETKQLIQNDVAQAEMAEENVMTNVGTTNIADQTNVYQDANNHQSVQKTTKASTETGSFSLGTELYEASNGSVDVYSKLDFSTPKGSYTSSKTLTDASAGTNESFKVGVFDYVSDSVFTSTQYDSSTGLVMLDGDNNITSKRIEKYNTEYRNESGDVVNAPRAELGDTTNVSTTGSIKHNIDISRNQVARVTNADTPLGTQELAITTNNKEMGIYQSNDGIKSINTVKADVTSFTGSDDSELVEIDTVANTMTVKGRLIVTNPEDFKGDSGTVFYHVYQYAVTNSSDDADWHDNFAPLTDKWRRQAEVTGTADNPITGPWSDGFLLSAEDGLPGDSLWFDYDYAAGSETIPPTVLDPSWHDVMVNGDRWRRERVVTDGTPGAWSTPARIKGFEGTPSELTEIEYQYAIKFVEAPTNPYHYNFTTGDHFRRERWITFRTVAIRDAYVAGDAVDGVDIKVGAWNNYAQIVPINGVDYGLKQTTIYIYKRSLTGVTPTGPLATTIYDFDTLVLSGLTNGWTQAIPSGTDPLWVGVAVVTSLGSTDAIGAGEWDLSLWSANGEDGLTPSVVSLYCLTDAVTTPTLTFTSVNHTLSTNAVSVIGTNTNGWQGTIPTNVLEGGRVWVTTDVRLVDAATTPVPNHLVSAFSVPAVFGQNGNNGSNGSGGAGFYKVSSSTLDASFFSNGTFNWASTSSTNQLESVFRTVFGKDVVKYDVVTVVGYADPDNDGDAGIYDEVTPNNGWATVAQYIHGNLVVDDTIRARHLVANTITGDKISANTVVLAGTGSNTAGMNGTYGAGAPYYNWRFWAGGQYPGSSTTKFRVDNLGNVYSHSLNAVNATISGSSTFAGTINGADGNFTGTIYADEIVGDVVSAKGITTSSQSFSGIHTQQRCLIFNVAGVAAGQSYSRTCEIPPIRFGVSDRINAPDHSYHTKAKLNIYRNSILRYQVEFTCNHLPSQFNTAFPDSDVSSPAVSIAIPATTNTTQIEVDLQLTYFRDANTQYRNNRLMYLDAHTVSPKVFRDGASIS